jgi:hypothetical protein
VLTRIPWAPNAAAQDRVKDSSAALAAAVAGAKGTPTDAPIEEMLTIAPDPRAIIFGTNAAVRKNGARTSTSNIMSNDSTSCSNVVRGASAAALLTSTSMSPACSARRRTDSMSFRLAAMNSARPPCASIAATVCAPRWVSRPLMTTPAPRRANSLAASCPIPAVAPVTNTRWSSSSITRSLCSTFTLNVVAAQPNSSLMCGGGFMLWR